MEAALEPARDCERRETPRPGGLRAPSTLILILTLAATTCLLSGCPAPSQPAGEAGAPSSPPAPEEKAEPTDVAAAEPVLGEDPDLSLARKLLQRDRGVLFGGEAPGEEETRLLEDIRSDIAGLDFGDDPEGREVAHSLFGENPLLSERNPLLSNQEREQWLAVAIKNVGQEMALQHLREEARRLAEGEVDRAQWYAHVAECEKVCNQIVSGLLHSHVRRVRELPHRLVLFANDQAGLSREARGELEAFLTEVEAQGEVRSHEVLLIGRASRSGAKEYNRRLSERRVSAVRAELGRRGWGDGRIHGFGLGYEPPQITEEIARLYGIDPSLSDAQRNQSVLVVAHPLQEPAPPPSPAAAAGR